MTARSEHRVVHLNRALSKLGILTRSEANVAILAGRVEVNGRIIRDPAARVDLQSSRFAVDGRAAARVPWRLVLFHKPRGVVTTRRDPEKRTTIYEVLGDAARGLLPVGRLDRATSGLLILTSDTTLASWLTDPANAVSRIYVVTVRGCVSDEDAARLVQGFRDRGEWIQAGAVAVRKRSNRESHLTIELREGRNREIRRLCTAIGREVTRLKRVQFGGFELGDLPPGASRDVSREEVRRVLHNRKV